MLPTPEEGLRSIGATIRAARLARGLTQQKAAKEAKVSRAQLALLEQGGNVSIKFLLKIATFLELTHIPLDGHVELTSAAREGWNVYEWIQTLDLVSALVEHLRGIGITAVLPPSARTLEDTLALREFVARHLGDDAGVARLAKAIVQLSEETQSRAAPPRVSDEKKSHSKSRRSRREVG